MRFQLNVSAQVADVETEMATALRIREGFNMGVALYFWQPRKQAPLVHDSVRTYTHEKSTR